MSSASAKSIPNLKATHGYLEEALQIRGEETKKCRICLKKGCHQSPLLIRIFPFSGMSGMSGMFAFFLKTKHVVGLMSHSLGQAKL